MSTAQLIEAVMSAPADRQAAILAAARGTDKPRPGTITEAAAILGCCNRSVERYARQGLLQQIRITPRKIRYDLTQVERLATRGADIARPIGGE